MSYLNKKHEDLQKFGESLSNDYLNAEPFPSIYIDDFFDEQFLNEVLNEFPDLSKLDSINFNDPNQKKFAGKGESTFGYNTRLLMHYLNSEPFLLFLTKLTGIKEKLIPDPYFEGGGLHEIKQGGLLKVHADFNKHSETRLDRRINVLVYLNKDWEENYGGHFELWDKNMKKCVTKITPKFNRVAIFSTTDVSYHGHPDPLNCPSHRSRKSLALYYFTNGRPINEKHIQNAEFNTVFKGREGYNNDVMDLNPNLLDRIINKLKRVFS
jgi:hypothetical protein